MYTETLKLALFWLQNGGSTYTQCQLIHGKIRYLSNNHCHMIWIFSLYFVQKQIIHVSKEQEKHVVPEIKSMVTCKVCNNDNNNNDNNNL